MDIDDVLVAGLSSYPFKGEETLAKQLTAIYYLSSATTLMMVHPHGAVTMWKRCDILETYNRHILIENTVMDRLRHLLADQPHVFDIRGIYDVTYLTEYILALDTIPPFKSNPEVKNYEY